MTLKFLGWVTKLDKCLDWISMFPQIGDGKREASFRETM